MRRRTPQEKKRLSYERDRRNGYGQNDKSSRRNVRQNKRAPNRASRRLKNQTLSQARGIPSENMGETVENRLSGKRRSGWRKAAGIPLGEYVAGRLERRIRLGIDTRDRARSRIERIRHTTRDDGWF